MKLFSITSICFLLLAAPTALAAQTYQGGVRGSVRDASGGILPGTTVTLTDEATNVPRTAFANELGEYVFARVAPGTYSLIARLAGFAPYTSSGLEIGIQDFLVIDVTLEVGGIEEAIIVTGETPLTQMGTASIGSTIDKAQIEVLPSPNRNVFIMALTTPGVVHTGNPFFTRQVDQDLSSWLSLGGGPLRGNNYTLDGVAITDMRNRAVAIPNFGAVQEMKVQVSTYDAEMGRTGGGVFNTIHRSGSNEWHGAGLWQNRPHWGQSRNFFEELNDIERPEIPYNLYGGSFGGPIFRDQTFFWISLEGFQQTDTSSTVLTFPTQATANGDFSGTGTTIFDPLSLDANGNRLPFPGNVIPPDRLDPVGLALAQQLLSVGSGNVPVTIPSDTFSYQVSGKVNHSFSDAWQLAGTYLFYNSDEQTQGRQYTAVLGSSPVFEPNLTLFRRVHVVAINSTHVPSDNSVLTLRYGYNSFYDSPIASEFSSAGAAALGWQGDWLSRLDLQNFPRIDVDGYGRNRLTHGPYLQNNETRWKSQEVSGTFSQFMGSHTLKYGGQWRRLGLDFEVVEFFRFNFFSDFTEGPDPRNPAPSSGDALASLLLGLPQTSGSNAILTTPNEFFLDYFSGFIQDDWRVSSNLLLTLGLRIEHESGLRETNDNFTVGFSRDDPFPIQVDPPADLAYSPGFPLRGGLFYSGVNGAPTHQWDPPSVKLGPRIGFNYSLDESVIRGGYGLFWAPYALPNTPDETRVGTVGYTATSQYVGSFDGITPASEGSGSPGSLTDPYPSGLIEPTENSLGLLTQAGGTVHFNDQFRKSPYIQKWSIDFQRDIASIVAIKVGYLGSKGSSLAVGGARDSTSNINQLDSQFLSLGSALDEPLPNPFLGISELGALSRPTTLPRGQLLRPFPQFRDVFAHHVSEARSRYDAFVVEVEKKFRGNWGARVNYTWSRLRDNIYESNVYIENEAVVVFNRSDIDGDFGASRTDTPHWLNLTGLYRLPSPDGGAAKALLGGWSVSVRALLRSGFPLTITQRTNNLGRTYGFDHQRPNMTGVDPNVPGNTEDIFENYINPAAFENAPAFTFGDTPQTLDTIRSPKLATWDFSFEKMTNLSGDVDLTLRFEVINLFNGVYWRGPRSILGRSDFGRIPGTRGFPRTFQFMVKVTF